MRSRIWVILPVLVVVAACSGAGNGGDDDAGGGGDRADRPAGGEQGSAPAEVEAFSGPIEAFYDVPDPLPAGEPGELIRTMPIETDDPGQAAVRVMYHSTDAEGDDRAVTGVVFHPTGEAPEGGWPIVAWAHGTSGMAPQCAPSRIPMEPPGFGIEGVRVATDYIGLGPNGELHAYLSAAAEGHAVIDGVAAARALPDVNAGDRWVAAGHSQGGHAALVTNERAAERLPDVELLGTVAIAPASELAASYGDQIQIDIVTAMALFGAAYEDPTIDTREFLNPEAHAIAEDVFRNGCVGDVIGSMVSVAAAPDFYTADPRTDPVGSAWIEANNPGQVASDSPLLVVQGDQDVLVVPARTDALMERLCGIGQVVDRLDLPTADHDTEMAEGADEIAAWLAARLAGDPAPNSC